MKTQVFGKVYQGYYNDFYLRSSYEYVFLKVLEKKGLSFTMEEKTYEFSDGTKYTPDFFIYDDVGVLQRIVEIKAEDKQYYAEGVATVKKMKEEFNISVDLLSLQELIQICKENDLNFYQLSQEWKEPVWLVRKLQKPWVQLVWQHALPALNSIQDLISMTAGIHLLMFKNRLRQPETFIPGLL